MSDNEGFSKTNKPGRAAWYYEMIALGYNFRITDLQCALGLSQLKKLDAFIRRRREIAARYTEAFSKSPVLVPPFQAPDRESAWHLYMLRLRLDRLSKTRRQIFDSLRELGIGVHVHYIPLHLLQVYRQKFGCRRGDYPEAEAYYDSALTLPLFPSLSDEDVRTVIDGVLNITNEATRKGSS
jgi:dTDP-4-amino-4,6-dideoxygalactose transaminase